MLIKNIIRIICLISLLLFLCSCGTAYKKKEYYGNISNLKKQQSLSAALGINKIQITYGHGGNTNYLYASWNGLKNNNQKYYHELSKITFSQKPVKIEDHIRQIPVLSSNKWQDLLEKVKYSLAPEHKGQGISLEINYREMVLYRDWHGNIKFKSLKDVPAHVKIINLLKENSIAAEIIKILEASPKNITSNSGLFLYKTGNTDHGGVAFVFIDTNNKQSIFLTTPYYPEYTHDPGVYPDAYMVRWFYRSCVIALLKNPFTTIYRLGYRLKHSAAIIFTGSESLSQPPVPPDPKTVSMDLGKWEKKLDRMFPENKPFKGNVKFLIDGDNFFPRLIHCLREAKKTIWFRTYIFDNDDYAVKIADILKGKSQDTKIRVLADHMGCMSATNTLPSSPIPPEFKFPSDIFDYLKKDSKVKVRATTNPWFTADHTKSIIIDNNTAFVGGMNIGREYRYEWHDLMMEVKGPVVGRLKKDFRRAWSHAGPFGDIAYALSLASSTKYNSTEKISNLYDIRTLYTKSGKTQILDAQLEAIKNSKRYIYIQNPYFSENTILNELIIARRRGVDVRVILPSNSGYGLMDSSNIVTTNIMIKNGIRVYHYPGISHIKAAIYDGWACLGSANFDALSLRINIETNLAFSNPVIVEKLKKELFEKDFLISREVNTPAEVTLFDYVGEMISNHL